MYTSELLLDYIEHLEVEGGRSAKTAENYRRYLERFIEFAGDITVNTISQEIIRKFRRVKVRVELTGSMPYPEAAIDIAGNLCKDFFVTDNPGEYESTCTP